MGQEGRAPGPDPDGSASGGGPPPPADRLWLHPSELPLDPGLPRDARPRMAIPLAAGLTGALFAVGMAALVWRPDGSGGPNVAGAGSTVTAALPTAVRAPGAADAPDGPELVAAAGEARIFVLRVTAWTGIDPRYASAVVFRADGLVVTSAASVAGADAVEVRAGDGQSWRATIRGTDPENDLALLEVKSPALEAARFEHEGPVEPGAACVLVGAPETEAEPHVLARGTISAVDTVVAFGDSWLVGAIEVEVPSGTTTAGATLLDDEGRLIGMVTSWRGTGGDNRRVAVPAAVVRRSVRQLIDRGWVEHAWLGVTTTDVSVPGSPLVGARIAGVAPGGPAELGGIEVGDVVLAVDGTAVTGITALIRHVRAMEVGDIVVLDVLRGAQRLSFPVELAGKPSSH